MGKVRVDVNAMGADLLTIYQQANGALRLSLGYATTAAEVKEAARLIVLACKRHAGEIAREARP